MVSNQIDAIAMLSEAMKDYGASAGPAAQVMRAFSAVLGELGQEAFLSKVDIVPRDVADKVLDDQLAREHPEFGSW